MKIVIILDAWEPIIGGGQKLFQKLTRGLVKNHRCQIEIVTRSLKDEKGKKFYQNQTLLDRRLKITRLGPCLPWNNLFGRFWFTFQSAVYCLKFNPDLFLASTFLPAISLQLIKLVKKIPQALVVIGFGADNKLYRLIAKFLTETLRFDLLITDDWNFFRKIKTKRNIQFIPNGVNIPRQASQGENIIGNKWPNFTFLTVARNEPRKGIPVLMKAFGQFKKQFPKVKLRLIGPGFKKVSDDELEKEFFKAHCLVLPSLQEGHPLVLFEAWAHRLPVIATDVGSVSQFVNSDNGYLIPAGDEEALIRAMKLSVKNQYLKILGQNGYQLVSQQYSWDKTVSAYYQALKKVVFNTRFVE